MRIVSVLLVSALAMTAAPASATSLPEPGPEYPMSEAGETVQGRMGPPLPVQISVAVDEVARAGGRGSVDVSLTRQAASGPSLRNLKVVVAGPRGARMRSAVGPGWRCRTMPGRTTCVRRKVSGKAGVPPIRAVFDVRRSFDKPTARIAATASWQGGPKRQRSSRTTSQVPVYSPLKVSLESGSGPRVALTASDGRQSRQFLLSGRIRGIDGGQVDARWKQVGGPRTTFLHAKRVQSVKDRVGQIVQVPKRAKSATYRFALIVDGNGQRVVRTVRVKTRVERKLGAVNGNDKAFVELAAGSRAPLQTRALKSAISNGVRLRGSPRLTVAPGAATRVRMVTQRRVASVRWSIGESPAGRGRAISVKAPSVPRTARLVTARVTLRNGTVVTESALVRSSGLAAKPGAGEPTDADRATVCSVADEAARMVKAGQSSQRISLDLGGKYTLSIAAKDVEESEDFRNDEDCTGNGTLTIDDATLQRGTTATLVDIAGSITAADGVQFDEAGWPLPDAFSAVAGVTSVKLGGDKPVRAGLDDGAWGLPQGELSLQPFSVAGKEVYGLEFLPLPDGWKFTGDKTVVSFINSSKKAPEIADGTMRFSQEAAGNDATVQMSVDSTDGQWVMVKVVVANLSLGQAANGATMMAAGNGTLDLTKGNESAIDLSITCKGGSQSQGACEVLNDLFVKDFRLVWNRKVIGITGTLLVRYGTPERDYQFGLRGAYSNPGDWSIDGVSPSDWSLGTSGLQLTGLAGSVGMKPLPKDPKTSKLRAQFTGGVKGFATEPGVTVTSISASLTNICPQDEPACDPGEIRLALAAAVTAQLPGGTQPVPLATSAYVNLSTLQFRFDFGFQDVSIGPDALSVKKAQFIMTNMDLGTCTPTGQPAAEPGESVYTLQVLAQATVLGSPLTVGGSVNRNGYCLWGKPGTIDLDQVGKTRSQIFGYTSFPGGADLRLPTGEKQALKASQIQIGGVFTLPSDIEKAFKIPSGQLQYVASYTTSDKGLSFDLSYTPSEAISVYSNERARLSLTGVRFGIAVSGSTNTATLKLAASGALFVKGGAGTPDSTTPLGISADFTFGKDIEAKFQAGVITEGGKVDNAFGQPGLTVRQLAASFVLRLPNPTANIGFNADVTLPQQWVQSVGIQPRTREALAVSLGETNWCLAVELGEQDTASSAIAVDLANKGFLTAGYFKLVVAPTGCEVPIGASDTQTIAPGFGFAFVGKIVGAPLIASINATWQDGLAMNGTIQVPALDLYAVRIQGSVPGTPLKIVFDIDSAAKKYDVAFDGGIAIGKPEAGIGAFVAVRGALKTSDPDFTDFSLDGKSTIAMGGVINIDISLLQVQGHIAKDPKDAAKNALSVRADMTVKAMGIGIRAAGALSYSHQQLVELMIQAGTSLDIVIASVSGNVQFNYCLGTLSRLDSNGSRCAPYEKYVNAKPAYRVGFFGAYRIAWWNKQFLWTAYDQPGAEGGAPSPASNDPGLVTGGVPSLTPKWMNYDTLRKQHDLAWQGIDWKGHSTDFWFKTISGVKLPSAPACDVARLGAQWTASAANPATTNVDPQPRAGIDCGLLVDWVNSADRVQQRAKVRCTDEGCFVQDGDLKNRVLSWNGSGGPASMRTGRDAILAGLRTPPGVLPGDTGFVGGDLWSPNGVWRLSTGPFGLVNTLTGDYWFPSASEATSWALTADGQMAGQAKDGSTVLRIGSKAPLDPEKYPVFLFVQDGMQVAQAGPDGQAKPIWGINEKGVCFPNRDACAVRRSS